MDARKKDTRHKIELGGLVMKAGLGDEEKSVVLGALMLASNALFGSNAQATRERFKAAGDAAFSVKKEHHDESKD